jgi:hypothetical protein
MIERVRSGATLWSDKDLGRWVANKSQLWKPLLEYYELLEFSNPDLYEQYLEKPADRSVGQLIKLLGLAGVEEYAYLSGRLLSTMLEIEEDHHTDG